MQDRILSVVTLLLSGVVIFAATKFHVPYQYEPLGPKAFPVMIAGLLAVASLWLFFRPDEDKWQPSAQVVGKLVAAVVLMFVYALLYDTLGFLLSTLLISGLFSWLFGARPVTAALYAAAISIVGYFVLSWVLELNVPTGRIVEGLLYG